MDKATLENVSAAADALLDARVKLRALFGETPDPAIQSALNALIYHTNKLEHRYDENDG